MLSIDSASPAATSRIVNSERRANARSSISSGGGAINSAGGDAFFEEGIHWLHLANSLGPRITSIQGYRPTASREGPDQRAKSLMAAFRYDNGAVGWFGPRPPPGHGLHRYHFQIFALAAPLTFGPGAPLETLVSALKGDTLANGMMVALYEAPGAQ